MFDLFRSRDKMVRYVLTGLLALVALSMVTYLVPGAGSPTGPDEQIIAKIGDESLTLREVQMNVQAAMRNKQFPIEMIQNYIPEYINQMIAERAMAYQAQHMGFDSNDADTAAAIKSMLPNLFPGGQFNAATYEAFLRQQNLTVPEFEANVHKQLLLTRLRNIILEGMIVTNDEVEKEYRRRNEKVKVDYIVFSPDKMRAKVTVSDAELKDYFTKHRPEYMTEEKRSFDLYVVDEQRVAESFAVTENDLRTMYAANQDRFRLPERVQVRHILLTTTGKSADEVKKIEAKANDLLKQLKAGGNFAELAKKNSEDPGSGAKGGELGWVVRGQMVKNFEDASFTQKVNELTAPVKTEYGFHIVQVTAKEAAHLKPFEEVKAELTTERKKQGVFDRMQQNADQIRIALLKSPAEGEELARKLNVPFYHVEKAGPNDPIQEIGVSKDLFDSLASVNKGGVTPTIAVPGNKIAIAVLRDVTPVRQAELNEVEGRVKDRLIADKARQLALDKGREASEKMKSAGDDFKKLAKELGAEIKSTPDFGPDGAAEGIGSANYLAEAFTKPVGTIIGPLTISEQVFVVRVAGKTPADMSKLPAERENLVTQLKGKKSRERQELFEDGLVTALIKSGKIKKNEDAIKRLVANFRG
jgi:peptidyl-prolyl cis-trans isomerase D